MNQVKFRGTKKGIIYITKKHKKKKSGGIHRKRRRKRHKLDIKLLMRLF